MPASSSNSSGGKYVPPGARAGRVENRPTAHHFPSSSSPSSYKDMYGSVGRAIPDWSTHSQGQQGMKQKARPPLLTIDNFPSLVAGSSTPADTQKRETRVHAHNDAKQTSALTWAAPTPAAGIAPSLTGSGSASEGGGDPTSTSTLVTSDDSPDRGKGEYAGRQDLGMPMETVLPLLLNRAGRHPGSERDLLLYISTESKGYGHLVHFLYDHRFYSEEHMQEVLTLLSERFEEPDFASTGWYEWKRIDCRSLPHPFLEHKADERTVTMTTLEVDTPVTTKVTICSVWFEKAGKTGQRGFIEDLCRELERPIISLHRKHKVLHAGQINVTEEEIRPPRVVLQTRMPGVSPTGLPR